MDDRVFKDPKDFKVQKVIKETLVKKVTLVQQDFMLLFQELLIQ